MLLDLGARKWASVFVSRFLVWVTHLMEVSFSEFYKMAAGLDGRGQNTKSFFFNHLYVCP